MSIERDELTEQWIEGIWVPSVEDMRDRLKSLTFLEILAFYKRQRDKLRQEAAIVPRNAMLLAATERGYEHTFDIVEPKMREKRKEMMEFQALVEQGREMSRSMGLPWDSVPYPFKSVHDVLTVKDDDDKDKRGSGNN